MLTLCEQQPLFVGGTRYVYQHPEHTERCIKVLRPERTGAARRARKRGWKRLLPASAFDDQLKEIRAYDALLARGNAQQWQYVPEYFGTVHTDAGLGIVTRLLRNADGSWPLNLERLLPRGMDEHLQAALQVFAEGVLQQRILTRDLLPHNMIAVYGHERQPRIVVVDGIGNADFIPLANYSDRAARAKVRRKLRRLQERVRLLLPVRQQETLELCNF